MPQPQLFTPASAALLSPTPLQAGNTSLSSVSFTVDFSTYLEGVVQVTVRAGPVPSRVSGCQVAAYSGINGTTYDTTTPIVMVLPVTASAQTVYSLRLQTGFYSLTLTNVDIDPNNNGGSWIMVSALVSEYVILGY